MCMYVDYHGPEGRCVLGKAGGHQVVRRARVFFLVILFHSDGGACREP